MDEQHFDESADERLVRATLLAAFPPHRPVFSQRRGEQIIRAAAVEQLNRRPVVGSRIAASMAAAFTLLAGTAGAAGAALPGQPLYPIKRIVERAMVAVTSDDGEAARLELRFAERRLREAAAVTEEPVASALADKFNEHVNAASALGGGDVSDEIDSLQQAQEQRQVDAAVDQQSAPVPPVDQSAPAVSRVPQSPTPATPTASPSPLPSATPTPSATPLPSPSPTESVAPSTAPTPGVDDLRDLTPRELDPTDTQPIDRLLLRDRDEASEGDRGTARRP